MRTMLLRTVTSRHRNWGAWSNTAAQPLVEKQLELRTPVEMHGDRVGLKITVREAAVSRADLRACLENSFQFIAFKIIGTINLLARRQSAAGSSMFVAAADLASFSDKKTGTGGLSQALEVTQKQWTDRRIRLC